MGISDAPLSSCQEHYDKGDRVDGVYTIQGRFDSIYLTFHSTIEFNRLKPSKNIPAFNVTCEFGSGFGKTSISPKYENEFQYTSIPGGSDGCADPGCYTDNIR